jgi:hypothetical protein
VMTTTRTSLGILSEQTCLLTHLLPLQRLGAAVCPQVSSTLLLSMSSMESIENTAKTYGACLWGR